MKNVNTNSNSNIRKIEKPKNVNPSVGTNNGGKHKSGLPNANN